MCIRLEHKSVQELSQKMINQKVVKKLKERIEWFFDEFLMNKEYQKIRDGKKTSDQIFNSVQKVILASGLNIDLLSEYYIKTKKYPHSITLKKH